MKKSTLLTLSTLLTFSTATFADDTNWMSQIPNDRIFNQLIIPGTHDSGTYGITGFSKFTLSDDNPLPTWIEEISNILPISLVRFIVAGWSKTQPYTITDQLNNGIRYLDLRVCLTQSDFYISHALTSIKLSDALTQVQQFIAAHPSEIVLLDINHIYNVNNSDDETQLVKLIYNALGNNVIPNSYNPTDTMGQLRASNRNVIILMDTTQAITDPTLAKFAANDLWHQSEINSPWPNTSNITDLKNTLDAEMNARSKIYKTANNFFVLQAIDTENTDQVIDGIISPLLYPNNIQTYEQSLNNNLNTWLMGYINAYGQLPINIVIQDWFDSTSNLVPLAIQYDSQEVSSSTLTMNAKTQSKLKALKMWYEKNK